MDWVAAVRVFLFGFSVVFVALGVLVIALRGVAALLRIFSKARTDV